MNASLNQVSEKKILNPAVANYCYQLLEGIAAQTTHTQQHAYWLIELGGIYSLLLKELTRTETQFFPNSYTRSVFVFDNYRIPRPLYLPLKKLYSWVTRLSRHRLHHSELDSHAFAYCLKGLCRFMYYLSHSEPPIVLQEYYALLNDRNVYEPITTDDKQVDTEMANVPLLEVVLVEKSPIMQQETKNSLQTLPYYELEAFDGEQERVKITVKGENWQYLHKLVWKYARLNLINLQYLPEQSAQIHCYQTTPETLIALDPDCLYDASTVAECRLRNQDAPLWYIVNRFKSTETNYYFLRGAIVNEYLDLVMLKQPANAAEIFNRYLQRSPAHSLVIKEDDQQKLMEELKGHFLTLQNNFVKHYQTYNLSLEPTFISEIFGLRGRLDVMVAYPQQPDRRDVVELKTSKDPKKAEYRLIADKDLLQATCYNLLLDSVYTNRTGTSAILYSAADLADNPLRNAPNDIYTKQRFMTLRNKLAWMDYQLCSDPQKILQAIHLTNFKNASLWKNQADEIAQFALLLQHASDYEKAYFYEFVRFVACEQRAARIGANSERSSGGFATLWNGTPSEKIHEYRLLAYLTYNYTQEQDFGKDLHFGKTEGQTAEIVTFRVGDFALLYPQEPDGTLCPTKHQIVKVTIKEINKNQVIVSPINQYLTTTFFEQHTYWAIESEIIETAFDSMLVSLRQFLALPTPKKQLLLGLSEPKFDNTDPVFSPQLKYQQNLVLNQALAARDYFLLQGPPGTGKTKVMLKTLVERLLSNPKERIVLLAYTNRAVDEMCEALSMIDPKILYFRLGHSATTEHKQVLLSHYAKGHTIPEIRSKINMCRVFVATVLTWQRNVELSNALTFTTAIIDEASQLLEPQIIGVVGQVQRFILIGDEKQLPAVVAQSDESIPPQNKLLPDLGIHNLCDSLFERLLLNCQQKKWNRAFGMLHDQGRMHSSIEAFPNKHYYGGRLNPLSEWQSNEQSELHEQTSETLQELGYHWLPILQKTRLVYIDTPTENRKNTNLYEAKIAGEIAQELAVFYGDALTEESIGIITPYRAQIAEIKRQLSEELLDFVSIDTVERYQGSQRRVIIISLAVNNPHQLSRLHVFNHDGTVDKKLNVALTRAKAHLVVIGNSAILRQSPMYQALIGHFAAEGQFLVWDKLP